ncbi:phosphomannomutase [Candidatus Saccharibacteria bacterium CG_4_10_14_0_2_um_filter_52_9]|nr:MAG: phosphomannomutase [Candidatus Saccharibacteria bacterium CG_4_10_14_0_2_um_filter_52_9]
MKVNPQIFRGYDLRGLVDKDLSPEIALHLGKAYGTYLSRQDIHTAIVSRDCRATGPSYSKAISEGLRWAGIDVTDIGMQLVGTFYWSQYHLKIPAGVYVSASHNPPEFNGFKFANGYSETLVSDGMQQLRQMVEDEDYDQGKAEGSFKEEDIRPAYYEDLTKRLPITKRFKVVVDPSCTTAGDIAPEILRKAGCEVVEYNTNVDSSFPLGVADPTETQVVERLRDEVLESKADIGFTYDADGDRIGIVDEAGNIIWNDVLLALFAIDVLRDHPGSKIMFNTLCSKVVPETIERSGGIPFMWRTGHSFLKKKNQEVKAVFIGELSGHFFFSKDFYNHDDGLYSTLRLLQAIERSGRKLSELIEEMPRYVSSPEIKVFCPDEEKQTVIKELAPILHQKYPEAEVIDDQRAGDGIRLELKDGMFVVRYSQNGPYLTIKFEARDEAGYEALRQSINDILHQLPEIDWESPISANVEALTHKA